MRISNKKLTNNPFDDSFHSSILNPNCCKKFREMSIFPTDDFSDDERVVRLLRPEEKKKLEELLSARIIEYMHKKMWSQYNTKERKNVYLGIVDTMDSLVTGLKIV